ncbi:MAG: AAA family ATPase [Nanoarchaeota archaeon]
MDEWYEELDFEENPFSTNPSDFVKNLVARDDVIDELSYRVRSGSLVFIEGPEGSGKSSLLRALIREFRGRGKVIYVNSEKFEKKLNVEDLLVQKNGLLKGMIMKKTPKSMILFMDNVDQLSYKNMERIKHYFDEDHLKSVVFTGTSFENVGFSASLRQRLEGRVVRIPPMTTDQIVEMVRSRIGELKLFSDEILEAIAKKYDNNPKKVLKACEDVAEYVVSIEEMAVTEKHLEEVLGGSFDVVKKEPKPKKAAEEKPAEKQAESAPAKEAKAEPQKKAALAAEKTQEPTEKASEPKRNIVVKTEKNEEPLDEDVAVFFEGDDAQTSAARVEAFAPKKDEKKKEDPKKEAEEKPKDPIAQPIITDDKPSKEDEDDDFFADDFFADDFDEDEQDEKKPREEEDFDDFFDDDFEK